MSDSPPTDEALRASLDGRPGGREELAALVYEDLRVLTAQRMQRERPDHTLQPTALAHEALIRLVDKSKLDWRGRTHFLAVAATQVQRVLIDHARARAALKRGCGATRREVLEDDLARGEDQHLMLDLSSLVARLAETEPRKARVVELRFFGGLTMQEAADQLGISLETAKLDWRAAREWLGKKLDLGTD